MNSLKTTQVGDSLYMFLLPLLISLYFDNYVSNNSLLLKLCYQKKFTSDMEFLSFVYAEENKKHTSTQRLAHIHSSIIHNGQKVGTIQVFIN